MSQGNRILSKAARLVKLKELLQTKPWSAQELCRHLKLERRTVQRDLRTLRAMGENIESATRGRYSLARSREVKVHFTSVEAKAVYMALRLFAAHSSEYNEHYRRAVEKLARALPQPAAEGAMAALGRLRSQPNSARSKVAEDVARSWLERRRLEFTYRRAFGQQARQYCFDVYMIEVSPYYFNTYAIGVNHAHEGHRGKTLVLRLDRMANTLLTDETFEVDPSFDPEKFLASAWGVMTGEPEDVHLHFDREVAREVQSRTWHPSQDVQANPDGSVILKVRVNESMELTRWIRGWGPSCEVLLPEKLRKVVRDGWRPAPRDQVRLLAADPPAGTPTLSTPEPPGITSSGRTPSVRSPLRTESWPGVEITWLDRDGAVENLRAAAHRLRAQDPAVQAVYLFGSLAEGRAAPGSDADVLVLLSTTSLSFLDRVAAYAPHFEDVGIPVDVFVYSTASSDHPYVKRAVEESIRLA